MWAGISGGGSRSLELSDDLAGGAGVESTHSGRSLVRDRPIESVRVLEVQVPVVPFPTGVSRMWTPIVDSSVTPSMSGVHDVTSKRSTARECAHE